MPSLRCVTSRYGLWLRGAARSDTLVAVLEAGTVDQLMAQCTA